MLMRSKMQPHFIKTRHKSPVNGPNQPVIAAGDPLKQIISRNTAQSRQTQNQQHQTFFESQAAQGQGYGGIFAGGSIPNQMKVGNLQSPHSMMRAPNQRKTQHAAQMFS